MKNYSHLKIIISIFISIILTACATSNVASGYSMDAKSSKGILVLSLTANDEIDNFFLRYRNIQTSTQGAFSLHDFKNPADWVSPHGRLVVIELDEGPYEFYTWDSPHPARVSALREFAIPFRVHPGKVTYLGNFHIDLSLAQRKYKFLQNDMQQRDIALLNKKYPKLILDPSVMVKQVAAKP
jgi:hypothetical protein